MIRTDKIIPALRSAGYSLYRIKKDKLLSGSVITNLENGSLTIDTLDRICALLGCQPGDLLSWVPDELPEWEDPEVEELDITEEIKALFKK